MDILLRTCNSSWWYRWAPTVITTTEKNIKYQKLWHLKPITPLAQHSVWLTHCQNHPAFVGAIYCLSLKHSYEGNNNIMFLYIKNTQISVVLLFAFDQKLFYLYYYVEHSSHLWTLRAHFFTCHCKSRAFPYHRYRQSLLLKWALLLLLSIRHW